MKLLYIIPRMTHGGGMPNVLAEVKIIRQLATEFTATALTATVVAMENSLSTTMMSEALKNGLKVLLAPSATLLARLVSNADLTIVHYWNCPSMFQFFRFLADSKVPHRLCVSTMINGFTLPQVVPDWVYETADALIVGHPLTPARRLRPGVEKRVLPGFIRLPNQPTQPTSLKGNSFRMFHAGTLNYFKTHPRLIALHEGLAIRQYQFDIWGSGMDATFELDLAKAKSVVSKGFSTNIYADMAPYHVLCNPQTELSYGSLDKIMQESQWMGKPVIVLKNSYVADHITHNVNGIVANDEYDYRVALEDLAAQPMAYKHLSESTFQHTREHYQLVNYVEETVRLYERTIQKPLKVADAALIPEYPEQAALDGLGKWQYTVLERPEALSLMELKYALRCEGGLIHYYKAFPANVALRSQIDQLLSIEQAQSLAS